MQSDSALDSKVARYVNIFRVDKACSLSHHDSVRTRAAVIVQRGDFVIAGGCSPLENVIRCGSADELLAGEPENFTHVGVGFGA
jgi:hypothetical protein